MSIRFTTVNDASRMLDIYGPYVLRTPISFETEVPELDESKTRISDTSTKFPWLVYEIEGTVVGFS